MQKSVVSMTLTEDTFESVTHSFIVKIWLEEEQKGRWRGHVTHVPGGERQYVEALSDVVEFIAPYVEGMKGSSRGRLRRWLTAFKTARK
jgi:hypothetical protein